jgi:hypothetical protein
MSLAGDTAETSIDMRCRLAASRFPSSTSFISMMRPRGESCFIAEDFVRRACWQTEAAVNAGFNGMPHGRATRPKLFGRNSVKHA